MSDTKQLTFALVSGRLTLVPVVLAAVIGFVRFRQLPNNLRYLAGLAWFELPLEVAGLLIIFQHGNNLFLMPIYIVGELGLLVLIYQHTLHSATFTKTAQWLIVGFAIYVAFDSLVSAPGLSSYRPGQQVVQSVFILGLVGLYFRKLLNELWVMSLTREPMFWVSVGLSIYFLGYLQIALFSDYMLRHYSLQTNRNIWSVQNVLHILLHSCYCLALWMRPAK
ncbi:hypothetical protein ACFQ48_02720 [Hymenobacter caeli]|uniref:Lysoplasmalogenase n=1 Tax=Hymenobacter caeli TaxID=2735894 RepID=A0ABX2FMF5_9BACT|nr:hypothetical protein [Hymenobacter caeli]NRT17736.1 hypothetical protein [Hymenobacter caeli]